MACGERGLLKVVHRLTQFIYKNPPNSSLVENGAGKKLVSHFVFKVVSPVFKKVLKFPSPVLPTYTRVATFNISSQN